MGDQAVLTAEERRAGVRRALDVLRAAAGVRDARQAEQVARQALAISEDCVEAWLALAGATARSAQEARPLIESAVAAGDRLFAERRGHIRFGTAREAQPYMQARAGLAQVYWELDERGAAVETLRGTLALDPDDHLSQRYVLLKALLDMRRYDDAAALLDAYGKESSTIMEYSRLLCAWARFGAGPEARAAFATARRQNQYVLDYLLGLRVLPQRLPAKAQPGDEGEAIRYAAVMGGVWDEVEGAKAFLRAEKKRRMDAGTASRR